MIKVQIIKTADQDETPQLLRCSQFTRQSTIYGSASADRASNSITRSIVVVTAAELNEPRPPSRR